MLAARGFKEIYNLSGGIKGWNGLTAEGPVELNLEMIRGNETPQEIIRLAYAMEQNLGVFYRNVETRTADTEVKSLCSRLAAIEDKHKGFLLSLFNESEEFPVDAAQFDSSVTEQRMEGGYNVEEYLKGNERFTKTPAGILDLAMMLEAQALDLYLRFAEKAEISPSKDTLFKIANEEKAHLSSLGNLREKYT